MSNANRIVANAAGESGVARGGGEVLWNEGMTKAPPGTMLSFISCEKNVWICLYIKPGNFDPTALLPSGRPYTCTSATPGAEAVRCAHTGVGWKETRSPGKTAGGSTVCGRYPVLLAFTS